MMRPLVGAFDEHDGAYYAAKLKEICNVEISSEEAEFIAHETIRIRLNEAQARRRREAMDYFRQANPLFDFFINIQISKGRGSSTGFFSSKKLLQSLSISCSVFVRQP